jgi:YVTN family beta-propeller protein
MRAFRQPPRPTVTAGVDFSADGTKAYVTNTASTTVGDMATFTVIETIANVPSGTCAVAATMDHNQTDKGHLYVASNTTSGMVTVVDVGTNSVDAVLSVGVRLLGIGIRMWRHGRCNSGSVVCARGRLEVTAFASRAIRVQPRNRRRCEPEKHSDAGSRTGLKFTISGQFLLVRWLALAAV